MQLLSPQQAAFFDTFGFVVLRGAMTADIEWITHEFEQVFVDRGIVHDGTKRSTVVPFIDQRERLCTLLDHPVIEGLAASLLGDDFNYLGGDGNYYSGDTPWHSDGYHMTGRFMKVAFYLDPVRKETGALRVIPGSQRPEFCHWDALKSREARELWGIAQSDVPSVALDSQPGDVVAFNHNVMHSSFEGSTARRMFTLNLCKRIQDAEGEADLRSYINVHDRFWLDHMHSDVMRGTASPARMRHLAQVMEFEDELADRSKKARESTAQPSNN